MSAEEKAYKGYKLVFYLPYTKNIITIVIQSYSLKY